MLFFYIRHGEPTYHPDCLTPMGHKQAEAVAKRLAFYGLDKVYASTSVRARQTAEPVCELLGKELQLLEFCHEHLAWEELTVNLEDGGKTWLCAHKESKYIMSQPEVRNLGDKWYEHPAFAGYNYKKGMDRIADAADEFFRSLGYEHERGTGKYKVLQPNDDRVALFAHAGFGSAFMSNLLDIPYPMFSFHFDMCHSGVTVIDFSDEGGYAFPKVLTYSDDAHIYREGLPTFYNKQYRF